MGSHGDYHAASGTGRLIGACSGEPAVLHKRSRKTLVFGTPEGGEPRLPNVSFGSQPEVSQGRGNVRFRGYSGSRFWATECLLVARTGSQRRALAGPQNALIGPEICYTIIPLSARQIAPITRCHRRRGGSAVASFNRRRSQKSCRHMGRCRYCAQSSTRPWARSIGRRLGARLSRRPW